MRLTPQPSLLEGEWIQTAISRWAHDTFTVSRRALFDAFGFGGLDPSTIHAIGVRLPAPMRENISEATGIAPDALDAATMAGYHGRLFWLDETSNGFSAKIPRSGSWHWLQGSRFCPDCLRERPGFFATIWRSPWSFVCLRHRRILLDACPACQRPVVEMTGPTSDVFDPSTCRANLAGSDEEVELCRAPLHDTWEHFRVPRGALMLLVQQQIYNPRPGRSAMQQIETLQSAATGLRGGQLFEEIATLAELHPDDITGLFDHEKHVGVSEPKSAFAMAALTTAAFTLTWQENAHAASVIRRATFSRPTAHVPRGAGYAAGSVGELLSRWGTVPAAFAGQILRAHDPDLSLGARVSYDTAQSPSTRTTKRERTRPDNDRSMNAVPDQLWPVWANRLDIGGAVDRWALDDALARTLRRIGDAYYKTSARDDQIARVLRPRMTGSAAQTTGILRGLSELAATLDAGPAPIDYARRTGLDLANLLTRDAWERLCQTTDTHPGDAPRLLHARRHVHQRACATHTQALPEWLRLGRSRSDAAEYTAFKLAMTQELRAAIDHFILATLRHRGIDEPVAWTPHVAVDIDWPGRALDDIDIPRLHELLADGLTALRTLAREVNRPPNHVARAIEEYPRSRGHPPAPIDWSTTLPPRTHPLRTVT